MKIRNGFVSNSSSSSFIVAVGKVVDGDKLRKSLETVNNGSYAIIKQKDIISQRYPLDIILKDKMAGTESFTGASVEMEINPNSNEEILFVQYTGDEGDSAFYCDADDCEIDYDIDESFFTGTEAILIDILQNPEKHGLSEVDYRIGAARNG